MERMMTALINPEVTFVVPCYKLAHLLPDCVNSILSQTYSNFEVLIMDDCSPDNTAEVAQSFQDPRVKHVRNEINIGHIANFNKGISLARGKYIWLISADDRLRRPYVLERYVKVMDAHPEIGYVFCPAMGLQDGEETEIVSYSFHGTHDTIFKGHDFLDKLIRFNCVEAPSAMARKQCYLKGMFPSDLPWGHDWYLWCLFALYYDVAYLAEPMVNYRHHEHSITNFFFRDGINILIDNEIRVRWYVKEYAKASGFPSVARKCDDSIFTFCVNQIISRGPTSSVSELILEQFERSSIENSHILRDEREIRERVYIALGDHYYWHHDFSWALQYYEYAVKHNPLLLRILTKYVLLRLGPLGIYFLDRLSVLKRRVIAIVAPMR